MPTLAALTGGPALTPVLLAVGPAEEGWQILFRRVLPHTGLFLPLHLAPVEDVAALILCPRKALGSRLELLCVRSVSFLTPVTDSS